MDTQEEYEAYVPEDATFHPNTSSTFGHHESGSSVAYTQYSDGGSGEDVVVRMARADAQAQSRVDELRHVTEQYSPSTGERHTTHCPGS